MQGRDEKQSSNGSASNDGTDDDVILKAGWSRLWTGNKGSQLRAWADDDHQYTVVHYFIRALLFRYPFRRLDCP